VTTHPLGKRRILHFRLAVSVWATLFMAPVLADEQSSVDLSVLEPGVREALRQGRRDFTARLDAASGEREQAEAWGQLGLLYQAHHLQGPARHCYAEAIRLDSADFRWPYYLAYALQEQGRFAQAEGGYDQALAIDPGYTPARLRRGQVRLAQGSTEGAEADFREVLVKQPDNAAALAGLGQAAARDRRYDDAIRFLEAALQADPSADRLRYPLGMAYRQAGQETKARVNLRAYGKTEPVFADPLLAEMSRLSRSAQIYLEQGYAASRAGRADAAVEAFRKAVEYNPDDVTARVSLGQGLLMLGEHREAMAEFEQALLLDPDHPAARYRRGTVLEGRADDAAAAADYRVALESDPGYTQARVRLADALMRLGQYDQAATEYAGVDVPGDQRALFLYREGLAYLAGGRCGDALTALESARDLKPDSGEVFQSLARAYASCPDVPEPKRRDAVRMATILFQARPDEGHAETLAMASASVGNWQRAIEIQGRLVEAYRGREDPLLEWQTGQLAAYRAEEKPRSAWPPGHPVFRPEPLGAGPQESVGR
jgi:tetratricopeptide (TPR) repeat protein